MFKPLSFVGIILCVILASASHSPALAAPPEVEALIKQLTDKDESVRLKAAKELGKLKEKAKDAIPALTLATKDADEDVRTVAARSLAAVKAAIGDKGDGKDKDPDTETVAPMLKLLKSKKAADRVEALKKLGELGEKGKAGSSAAVDALYDTSEDVRQAAADSIEKIDPAIHKHIIVARFDQDGTRQLKAINALAKLGGDAKGAVPLLKRGMRSPEYFDALVAIVPGDSQIVAEVLRRVSLPSAQGTDAAESVFYWRSSGLKHLDAIETTDAKRIAALTSALACPQSRVDVLNRLAKFGSEAKTALPAITKLKLDGNVNVREAATKAIEAIKAE